MSEVAEKETVEINETEVIEAKPVPTRDELKSQGWSSAELENAEKRGMIAKPDEVKDEVKDQTKTIDTKGTVVDKPEDKKSEVKPEAKRGSLPDFTMNADQEKVFFDAFGRGTAPHAMYVGMKVERKSRQMAEDRAKFLEARLAALEAPKPTHRAEVDELGNEIDPENQPFTLKAYKEHEAAKAAEYQRQLQEQNDRARVVANAHVVQEEYARSIYGDFDDTVNLAKEVIQDLDGMVADINDREDVIELVQKMQVAAANADKIGLDQRHAAMIAYRIGKFHPKYGQSTTPKGEETGKQKDPKGNGNLTAEQMKRIEANTQRRASSASITDGGGKRTISIEDVDLAVLNKMAFSERSKFKEKHPERYAKLLRG